MEQLTKEQAIHLYLSDEWKEWTDEQIVALQLFQSLLCLPFERFHQAIEKVLGRPVWTHEFAFADNLRAEYKKERPMPTFNDVMNLIPKDKQVVIVTD